MHTDPTPDILSHITTSLGNSFCLFVGKTCAAFETWELEHKQVAQERCQEKTAVQKATSWKPKELNLKTYKYHLLGDYIETIQQFGTTDSYSTQSVSIHLMSHKVSLNVSGTN